MAGIAYDLFWLRNPVGVFWEGLLLLVNVVQLYLLWRKNRRAQFTPEEDRFISTRLMGLSPGRCRDFFDLGRWENLSTGTVLTRQNELPEFLTYLSEGTASITVNDQDVALVRAGHYIGEMSLLGDGNATATVVVSGPARVWRIEAEKIERLIQDRPNIANALKAGIAIDMRRKIVALNSAVTTSEP
ncbi:MAG: cyclic nucleotide-binding domain-containing protein [Tateyamaria sp.]